MCCVGLRLVGVLVAIMLYGGFGWFSVLRLWIVFGFDGVWCLLLVRYVCVVLVVVMFCLIVQFSCWMVNSVGL